MWYLVYMTGEVVGPYDTKAVAVMSQGWKAARRGVNGLYTGPEGRGTLGRKSDLIAEGFGWAFPEGVARG